MPGMDNASEAFQQFIGDKKILIADASGVSRANLAKVFNSLGVKAGSMTLVGSYDEAETAIKESRPQVVVCDYDLGSKCGLDLLQKQRFNNQESKESLFILVTGNTSQTAVARAAEEDVDTYILKPFTADSLKKSIVKAAITKKHPSEYLDTIEKGKDDLAQGKVQEAMMKFAMAMRMDPTPSLACFYFGQASLMKESIKDAEGSYTKGLNFNKIHYKCMVGMYELLMSQKRYDQAYDVVKRMSHYFPANPQRLTAVLRLAIMTASYQDVERYYQIFTKIDDRNDEIIKYICAALVVCGKHYLNTNYSGRGLELFQKAAVSASGRTRVLREIIIALVDKGLINETDPYMKRFPGDSRNLADYLACTLMIADKSVAATVVVEKARQMIAKGVHDPAIYKILIRRSVEVGLKPAAEELIRTAVTKWPDEKAEFSSLMKEAS